MANLNKVLLIGRLTKDPELRFTPQGTGVCDLSIATSRISRSQDGSQKEETCFVDIIVWGKQAEACAEYLKKGREVFIEGRLTLDRWETPDGQKRSRMRVTAERVQFLSRQALAERGQASAEKTEQEAPPETGQEAPPETGQIDDVPF